MQYLKINNLVLSNGNDFLIISSNGWQRRFHSQHSIFREGGLDKFGISAFGKQKFSVVFTVNRSAVTLLLMFGMNLLKTIKKGALAIK